ncbi:MAG: HDOD domain-containing protein [Nitrospirales bacterium]
MASNQTTTPSFLESLLADAPKTLPILRQSCIQVLNLAQDKDSSASDIGDIIKRDQGMMANIVKIANSPAFFTRVPVKTPTQAVTLIGFDVIQSMVVAAQLIEQAHKFGANTFCLKHLLARALVAATQAQELGKVLHYPESGFLFTNAMLYSLGDLILALCRPEVAEQLEALRLSDPTKIPKAELALLGRPLQTIAATMAKHWHLPDTLIQLLEKKPVWPKTRPENNQQMMEGIVRAANELSYCLLNPSGTGQEQVFHMLTQHFLPPFSLSLTQLEQTATNAFMQASEIASAISIDHQHLLPVSIPEDTPFQYPELQKLTLAIQHALDRDHEPEQEEAPKPPEPVKPPPLLHSVASSENPLLEYTLAAMKIPEPSKLLSFATKTLYASYGFERVLLAFLVPGKEKLEAKIGYGEQADAIQAKFHCPLIKGNFWYRLLHQYQPVRFLSLIQENTVQEIPEEFLQLWGNHPGLVGSLYAPNKPIGLILADRGISKTALTDTDFAAFSVILSQTNANLARLAQSQ